MRPVLTVLTDPVPVGIRRPIEAAKDLGRMVKYALKPMPHFMRSPYRGHFAVTRSLIEGLRKIEVHTTYNPRSMADVADVILVLSGVEALRQAIRFRRNGTIKRLLAGPNILVFASDHGGVITAPEVDLCITPSEITSRMYVEECRTLEGRCPAWPAGVDTEFWKPMSGVERDTVLIFEKQVKGPVGPIKEYREMIESLGYKVQVLTYGSFSHADYRRALQYSMLMIGFVRDESQGIAWAEAWAADVPTLIWRNTANTHRGRTYFCSTAPYLTSETGMFFDGMNDFESTFLKWKSKRDSFKPRRWVLENMSDEVSARELCRIAGIDRSGRI